MINQNIKGIIFDLDGVLISTDHFHYLAWKRLADEYDIYFDEKINTRLRGVSRRESLEIILERYTGDTLSDDEKYAMTERKNAYYKKYLEELSSADVSQEVGKTLQILRQRGYLLAVGSSSKNASFILDRVGLTGYFDVLSDGNNIQKSKPDPEVFLKAAEMLKLPADQCLVVEDAEAGIQAAVGGSMCAVGIGPAADDKRAEAGIKTLAELTDLLL